MDFYEATLRPFSTKKDCLDFLEWVPDHGDENPIEWFANKHGFSKNIVTQALQLSSEPSAFRPNNWIGKDSPALKAIKIVKFLENVRPVMIPNLASYYRIEKHYERKGRR